MGGKVRCPQSECGYRDPDEIAPQNLRFRKDRETKTAKQGAPTLSLTGKTQTFFENSLPGAGALEGGLLLMEALPYESERCMSLSSPAWF